MWSTADINVLQRSKDKEMKFIQTLLPGKSEKAIKDKIQQLASATVWCEEDQQQLEQYVKDYTREGKINWLDVGGYVHKPLTEVLRHYKQSFGDQKYQLVGNIIVRAWDQEELKALETQVREQGADVDWAVVARQMWGRSAMGCKTAYASRAQKRNQFKKDESRPPSAIQIPASVP